MIDFTELSGQNR